VSKADTGEGQADEGWEEKEVEKEGGMPYAAE